MMSDISVIARRKRQRNACIVERIKLLMDDGEWYYAADVRNALDLLNNRHTARMIGRLPVESRMGKYGSQIYRLKLPVEG